MRYHKFARREFLKAGVVGGVGLVASRGGVAQTGKRDKFPVRTITSGPKFHWFGYYDKLEFDPTNRYVLGMEVDFEHRSPTPQDFINVGMVDLQDNDRWIGLGRSCAWCWQQGCMFQWLPGSQSTVLWNDREDDHYCCRFLDVKTGASRAIPHPVYAISPDGKSAVSLDFSRLNDVRPGYGYVGIPDAHADELVPEGSGLYRVDLESGSQKMILSLAEVAAIGSKKASMEGAKHKFNHLLFSPDGSRFIFLHRWTGPNGRETRMFTATPDGKDVRLVDDNGMTSHFIWRDNHHILAYSNQRKYGTRFYLFEDGGDRKVEVVGNNAMTSDGHCTYLPNREWILNDTYPQSGFQHVYLFNVNSGQEVSLGKFRAPTEYTGEWRCDTHPRCSRDGRLVVIDTPAAGSGRQLHVIDISELVG